MTLPLQANQLQTLDNGSALASLARAEQRVVVLVFTSAHCPYCVRLKADVLEPTLLSGEFESDWILREVDISAADHIIWLDGRRRHGMDLFKSHGLVAVPSMVFLDSKGNQLADALIGYQTPAFFPFYLEKAVLGSKEKIEITR